MGRWSSAGAINDFGQAAFITHQQHKNGVALPPAAYLSDGDAVLPMAVLTTGDQHINDINDGGVAVGTSSDPSLGTHVAVRYVNGVAEPLPLGCCGQTFAEGINNNGHIAGAIIENGRSHSFIYSNGQVQLVDAGPGLNSRAADINDEGMVVGSIDRSGPSFDDLTPSEAYLFKDGSLTPLGTLGGHSSVGAAINDSGSIVGSSLDEAGKWKAFLFDEGTGMRELAMPSVESFAYDVNDDGLAVGMALFELNQPEAVLYDPVEGGRLLKDLVDSPIEWTRLTAAVSINNRGQILGNGYLNHEIHVFLATPVPEPAAILAAAFGAMVVASLARRRVS